MGTDDPLLEIDGLHKRFSQSTSIIDTLLRRRTDEIEAVDDVSFTLERNEAQGIIGESGCGKTTLLYTIIGLYSPSRGAIKYNGTRLADFDKQQWKEYRQNVQMIFQNPFDSLDPRMSVREVLREPLAVHGLDNKNERIEDILEEVELQPAGNYLHKLPNQLSGGEKQRVAIARALILEPEIILADEPVSMLDVSTQADILNLLNNLVDHHNVSILYISHDLSTVSYVCDSIQVMYLGRIFEEGKTRKLIEDPLHPYTRLLIDAVPIPDPTVNREKTTVQGAAPDPIDLGEGCRFRDRCPDRMDICEKTPRSITLDNREQVACHLYYDHGDTVEEAEETLQRGRENGDSVTRETGNRGGTRQ